ncbi:MAG: hypothetical protein MJZ00_08230 [Paludibacteraceae bacterium]|nr:hypothetical protein [Paludibacteraceae bacterium]
MIKVRNFWLALAMGCAFSVGTISCDEEDDEDGPKQEENKTPEESTPSIDIWSSEDSTVIVKLEDLQAIGLTTDTLVDLGLSVKWANFNVGASKCYEYGNYYQWGETDTTDNYVPESCRTYALPISELKEQGIIGADSLLTAKYDAATVNWGAKYRMPSRIEIEELMNNTESKWLIIEMPDSSSVSGRITKSNKNGKSVFFPVAGIRNYSEIADVGHGGYCWSASAYEYGRNAWLLHFNSKGFSCYHLARRYGKSVRPVSGF